jgi:uncharacterized protein (DUF433 family)
MSPALLGKGIYDLDEVARLVRRTRDEVAGWTHGTNTGDALLLPSDDRLLSFYDLVTAAVTAELRRREVPLVKIRDARHYLAEDYGLAWPLASAAALGDLASVGTDVYVRSRRKQVAPGVREVAAGRWVDASRGGQEAFPSIIRPLLRRIEFDEDRMAERWLPAKGVVIDPRIQAGAPCIAGTRLTTELVADLVAEGDDPADVARDYDVTPAAVDAALAYERGLIAA